MCWQEIKLVQILIQFPKKVFRDRQYFGFIFVMVKTVYLHLSDLANGKKEQN